jgi:uncharacterized protein (UPF0332 family)
MTTHQFDWLSYLAVADHLRLQQGEGFYRSAISRAYYGVFGHIRDTLFSRGGTSHGQVINALRSQPETAQLGRDLDRLCDERNDADYETSLRFNESQARTALSQARSIRNRVANLLP